jgi:predicted transcriptional regulator
MKLPRLSNLEMQILEVLWKRGASTIRQVQHAMPGQRAHAYTTIQTVMNRLEAKSVLKRTGMTGAAHIFEAAIPPGPARRRLLDEFLAVFGGEAQPVMLQLIDAGKLSLDDIRDAERHLRTQVGKDK